MVRCMMGVKSMSLPCSSLLLFHISTTFLSGTISNTPYGTCSSLLLFLGVVVFVLFHVLYGVACLDGMVLCIPI